MQLDFESLLAQKSCGNPIDSTSNPNLMRPREADAFIDLMTDNSQLLKDITVIRTDKCKGEVPRLDVSGPISSGADATTCPVEHGILDSYLTYDMVKYRSDFTIKADFLECSKLGSNATDTLVNMFAKQINNDREAAAIEGNELLTIGDTQSAYNNLMGVNDGFIAMACGCTPSCQIIDAQGHGPSPTLFHDMRKALPPRYRGQRDSYRYIVGPQVYDWWALERSARVSDAGDRALATNMGGPIWGVNLYEVPLWPENLPFGSTGATEGTVIMYTPLANLVHFIQRDFSLEWERKPKCDAWEATMYWKVDQMIRNPDQVVLAVNVDPCGTPYAGCGTQCGQTTRTVNPCACCQGYA